MSSEVVRELFRNLENVLHDRLKVIEDILSSAKSANSSGDSTAVLARLQSLESHIVSVEEYAMGEVRTLAYNHDMLEKRVIQMENTLRDAHDILKTLDQTIRMMQQKKDDEKPVEVAEVEAEIEETEEAALNADADASLHEQKAKESLSKVVDQLQEEEEVEEEEEEVEEEEAEEEEVEEEVEEEEEAEEEEETEELELEEFEYKKKTYYRDQHNNVYIADEDGAVDPNEVVGIWNPATKKIERVTSS